MPLQIVNKKSAKSTKAFSKDFIFTPVAHAQGNGAHRAPISVALHKDSSRGKSPALVIRFQQFIADKLISDGMKYVTVEKAWDKPRERLVIRLTSCDRDTPDARKLELVARANPIRILRIAHAGKGLSTHPSIPADYEFDDQGRLFVWMPIEWSVGIASGLISKDDRRAISNPPA